MYFCAAKASVWIGLGCLTHGVGLFHTINSYNGFVFLSFLELSQLPGNNAGSGILPSMS
jgi:diacylglycerol O-acyltransferase / wax synthase